MLYASVRLWTRSGISTGGSDPKLFNHLLLLPIGLPLGTYPPTASDSQGSGSPEGLAEQGLPVDWCSAALGAQRLSQPQPA